MQKNPLQRFHSSKWIRVIDFEATQTKQITTLLKWKYFRKIVEKSTETQEKTLGMAGWLVGWNDE